jgi:hypothetical protein
LHHSGILKSRQDRVELLLRHLARATLELLSEEDELDLIVDGQDTGTGDTTENVGTSSLEQRLGTLSGNNLIESIQGRLVLDGLKT